MSKVSVESSNALQALGRSVGEIKDVMRDNLEALRAAFDVACENWQDKNAQSCGNALEKHAEAMRAALSGLGKMENAVNRLGELASMYEDIE